ncbi:family 16 glycosylhydrolase [Roseomonas sp. OT10]|uniref:family 16 glycosylhydrolase n=1 Tax=Roseomonas cutis TaxID=2897332 RepID=UPI001E555CAD|nr:family 16 glycosylhydrolase [Roseomonas sp. OT10]UFN50312.1 family 16 glycosylhydrolase [Roseomonas sp. OT10]
MDFPSAPPVSTAWRFALGTFGYGSFGTPVGDAVPPGSLVVTDPGSFTIASIGAKPTPLPATTGRVLSGTGSWTTMRNIAVHHDDTAPLTVRGFVEAHILATAADSDITLAGAKRGVIETGDGRDRVVVEAYSNARGAGNSFLVDTGAGDDILTFHGQAGMTEAWLYGGAGNDILTVSGLRLGWIDAGDGDDEIHVTLDGLYQIHGGAGSDVLVLSRTLGELTLSLSGGALFLGLAGNSGAGLLLDGVEHLRFSDGAEMTAGHLIALLSPAPPAMAGAEPTNTITGTEEPERLVGTDGHDLFQGGGGGDTMVGGLGDDTYVVTGTGASNMSGRGYETVVEDLGGGTDTVIYTGRSSYTLADNVENLILAYGGNRPSSSHIAYIGGMGGVSGYGNALANMITGDEGDNTIDGKAGNDVLTGGEGKDTFVFGAGYGKDTVTDFTPGVDHIRLLQRIDPLAAIADTPAGAVLTLAGGDTLTLAGITAAQLSLGDFEIPVDLSQYHLSFSDEFDSFDPLLGKGGDGGTWRTRTSSGLGNMVAYNDEQYFVDAQWKGLGIDPFSAQDGVLSITATYRPDLTSLTEGREYTSGVITTQGTFAQQYGYFEARVKMSEGTGFAPAFWLLPVDGGWPPEIDIMEIYTRLNDSVLQMGQVVQGIESTDWHTYGLEWTAEKLVWYIDGIPTYTVYGHGIDEPMYIILSYGVGGYAGSLPEEAAAGSAVGTLQIDWVRAYEANDPAVRGPAATVADGAPEVTYSIGKLAVGAAPAAADAFHYLADTTGWVTLFGEGMALASLTGWASVKVMNDRAADSYSAVLDNPWVGMNVQIADDDGGTYAFNGFAMAELHLGGTADSSVTIARGLYGLIETADGNDTVTVSGTTAWKSTPQKTFTVSTGAGDDRIDASGSAISNLVAEAGPGNDRVIGSALADRIAGGDGADTLTGGGGADIFVFRGTETGQDVITDFTAGTDMLRLEGVAAAAVTLTASGDDTLVQFLGASILVQGVAPSSLEHSFVYA